MGKRVSKEGRKKQILDRARGLKIAYGRCSFTMTDAAHWIGLKPSNYVLKMLKELVAEGHLKAQQQIYRFGRVPSENIHRWIFEPDNSQKSLFDGYEDRVIPVRHKGKELR